MRVIENHCCDCAAPGYPCLGSACSNRNVPVYYCDKCGEETVLYHYDDKELCIECIKEELEVVEGSDD